MNSHVNADAPNDRSDGESPEGNIRRIPKTKDAMAVALSGGKPGSGAAPSVVAGGRGRLAEQILQIAFANGIKVREDADLAQLLTTIDLEQGGAEGVIPTELGDVASLTTLRVYNGWNRGKLSGTLPSELGKLGSLVEIKTQRNSMSGTLPTQLARLTGLTTLHLEGNKPMSGTISSGLAAAWSLQSLGLGDNEISGTTPTELCHGDTRWHWSLGATKLSGTIPTEVGLLTRMASYFGWGDNYNTGKLSASFPLSSARSA